VSGGGAWRRSFVAAALAALACDGRQYVSPDTVALVISDESTGTKQLNECHYVPVLLGSRSISRYALDSDLRVTIDITRDQVSVSFEDPAGVEPFLVPSERFEQAATARDPAPPAGYVVELSSPCSP